MAFKITASVIALAVGLASADKSSGLPVLYRVDQDHSNVVVFRGADVAKAAAAGLIKGYRGHPAPPPAPTPAPYRPPVVTTTYAPPTTTTTTTTPAPTTTTQAYVPPPPPPTTPRPVLVYKPAPPVRHLPPPVVYKPVVYKPAPAPVVVHSAPAPHYNVPKYADVDPKYQWEYAVQDYNDFGHKEGRDNQLTTGKYYVNLPDGRTQVVTYTADDSGYHPVIEYSGQAAYPAEPPKKYEA